ncbi:SdiA-regulated domain-containing protein [Ulvibacter litoralis]|uniref:SdiA-regulated n=1 Tax=Ulvibacter litoralis TaxID=227084 RepID=A0A1G7HLP9_9FLAO|nr:SdiA-regulated domain-containing protein [Ulvibacter litoralis]GHC58316.1 hypothetical protein GCM10008083_23800 [Ulvibacter litoralis]SDF01392.1 SdiA-regulated [Ulvibacter litoralis]
MTKILFALLITAFTANCQDYGVLTKKETLPKSLKEISGTEYNSKNNTLWMVEDSGNSPAVYAFNPISGKIELEINITNATNIDWEDLSFSPDGNLYIGDFGNNNNDRKNLVIYTLKNASNISSSEAEVTKTNFTLEDQDKFPPKKKDRNYDIESFFFLNNHFYLFTRNRSKDFDGTTKLYKLNASEGASEAKLLGTFQTCNKQSHCQVTSAAIDYTTGNIALLTYNRVFIFSDYSGDDFFNGTVQEIKLKYTSQKEGITFKDSKTLYITDERNKSNGGNVYQLNLTD